MIPSDSGVTEPNGSVMASTCDIFPDTNAAERAPILAMTYLERFSSGLLMTGTSPLKRAGLAGENGFDAFEKFDIEFSRGIVAVQGFNSLRSDPFDQPGLEFLLRTSPIAITANTLAGRIIKVERQPWPGASG